MVWSFKSPMSWKNFWDNIGGIKWSWWNFMNFKVDKKKTFFFFLCSSPSNKMTSPHPLARFICRWPGYVLSTINSSCSTFSYSWRELRANKSYFFSGIIFFSSSSLSIHPICDLWRHRGEVSHSRVRCWVKNSWYFFQIKASLWCVGGVWLLVNTTLYVRMLFFIRNVK